MHALSHLPRTFHPYSHWLKFEPCPHFTHDHPHVIYVCGLFTLNSALYFLLFLPSLFLFLFLFLTNKKFMANLHNSAKEGVDTTDVLSFPTGSSRTPCKTKTSQETHRSLPKFLGPKRKPKVIYTDNSLEFGKACEDLFWNHCTSTNGIAERAVRRVKEGTSAVLLQSGLNESWWADSLECYTYLRNIQDLLSDGKTPYKRRFGEPRKGPTIPFGSLVECYPIFRKTSQESINWKESLTWIVLRICIVRGGEFGRVT